jgi:hypothetical protein
LARIDQVGCKGCGIKHAHHCAALLALWYE